MLKHGLMEFHQIVLISVLMEAVLSLAQHHSCLAMRSTMYSFSIKCRPEMVRVASVPRTQCKYVASLMENFSVRELRMYCTMFGLPPMTRISSTQYICVSVAHIKNGGFSQRIGIPLLRMCYQRDMYQVQRLK